MRRGCVVNIVCKFIATCTEEVNYFHEANLIFTYLVRKVSLQVQNIARTKYIYKTKISIAVMATWMIEITLRLN